MTTIIYDSDRAHRPIITELSNFWRYRGLIRLLTTRDLTVRYKRSVLGVWWTLLNPLLNVLVFWVVFSNIFDRGSGLMVPFIVYVTTGILFTSMFSQGVMASASAITGAKGILSKVHVPPEVFSFSASIAAGVNFIISLVALVLMQIFNGVSIPWTFALIPLSTLGMLMMVTGLGLAIASAAVRFYDVFDLTRVLTMLVTYMSASFYPISQVPAKWMPLFNLNPVYHHLVVFRWMAYGEPMTPANLWITVFTAVFFLAVGVWFFSRNWRKVVVTL